MLTADVTPENSNIWGGVHGGFLYAMADTAAGAFARINYSQHNVTLNGSINYLRSTVQSKALTAVGRPVRVGGHIGFFEVNITDDTGALIARAEINMYFLKSKKRAKRERIGPCPMRSLFHSCAVAAQFFWLLPLISAVTASATGLRSASRKNTLTFAAFDQSAFAHLSVTVSSSSAASLAA